MATHIHAVIDGHTCLESGVNPEAYREALLRLEAFREARIVVRMSPASDKDYSRMAALSSLSCEGTVPEMEQLYATARQTLQAFQAQQPAGQA